MSDNRDHPLVTVAAITKQYKLCWRIVCTTCGGVGVKSLCAMLDRPHSIGKIAGLASTDLQDGYKIFQESAREVERLARRESISKEGGDSAQRNLAEAHKGRLIQILASAPLLEVSSAGGFPDWLGVLGIALYLVGPNEPVTESWCQQFIEMGGAHARWSEFYPNSKKLLYVSDLETAESERLGFAEIT